MVSIKTALATVVAAAVVLASGAAAATVPPCVEDARTYTITAGETTFGTISSTTVRSCPAGDEALLVVRDPTLPALVVPIGLWTYMFDTNSADTAIGGTVSFTVDAMCGATVVCEATVTYEVKPKTTDGSATLPACAANPPTASYTAGVAYTGTLPLDEKKAECAYTARLTQPTLGAVSSEDTAPLQYVYVSPANLPQSFTSIGYEISCNGAAVCRGSLDVLLTPPTTTTTTTANPDTPGNKACSASPINRAYLAGMRYKDTFPIDNIAASGSCTYSAAVVHPTLGSVTAVEGLSYVYTSPTGAASLSTSLVYTIYCGAKAVCSDSINLFLQAVPQTPNLPSCTPTANSVTVPPGMAYVDLLPYNRTLTTCTEPLTALLEAPSSGMATVTEDNQLLFLYAPSEGSSDTRTELRYRIACNGDLVCQDALTILIEDTYPKCTDAPVQQYFTAGVTYTASVPYDRVAGVQCSRFTVALEQPSVGSAAIQSAKDPFQYIYNSPADTSATTASMTYKVNCEGKTLCRDTVGITLVAELPACPAPLSYQATPGAQVAGTLAPGATCSGRVTGSLLATSTGGAGEFILGGDLSFTYVAPAGVPAANPAYTATVRTLCDGAPLCDLTVNFAVTGSPTTPPTEPTTTTTTRAPTVVLPPCDVPDFSYTVPTGKAMRGTLYVPLAEGCAITTYNVAKRVDGAAPLQGSLQVNIIGDFLYEAPHFETVEYGYVDVSCVATPTCRATLVLTSYTELGTSTTTTDAPVPALPTCANVYYYDVIPGVALSSSLNGKPMQDPCVYGRYFSLLTPPSSGTIQLTPIGDFLYTPSYEEGVFDMAFTMYCNSRAFCQGTAYFLVSSRHTFPPTTADPQTTKPPVVIPNPLITCVGTCNAKAWKTYPNHPMWDNTPGTGYARKDGNAVDEIGVTWSNNALIFTVYTLIGNLGVRFPTFEPINSKARRYFESSDVASQVANTSTGFDLACLDHQGRTGMGEDVWIWQSLSGSTGSGHVGAYYDRGMSWYQKFGGKHDQCDTFADSCHYAPLLTPSRSGRWSVDIDDCDATWTGRFPYAELQQLVKADGKTPVWSFVGPHQLRGTLISEAVQASSWIAPGKFDTQYDNHDILIHLDQFVLVNSLSQESLLTVDAEFFTYRDAASGDHAFGINMLVYPSVTPTMTSSFAPDRHVTGFKWVEQKWEAPNDRQCPTCTGTKMNCTASNLTATPSYTGDFPAGSCAADTARVRLVKGPSMTPEDCPQDAMHVYDRPGFSAPRNCKTTYQNITFRGVLPGSAAMTEKDVRALNYEGAIDLQFLMDDSTKETMSLQLSMYVSRLTQDSKASAGGLAVCRSGSYWPVLDPLGVSLPDAPFALSTSVPTDLCRDDLSSAYGPSDWALFVLRLPGVAAANVTVTQIYMITSGDDTRITFFYRDPATGTAAQPPASAGQWWENEHPFLAFRDLSGRTGSNSTAATTGGSAIFTDSVAAFTFIPGALGYETNVQVVVETLIREGNATSRSAFRRMLHLDPLLTQLSRQGPAPLPAGRNEQNAASDLVAIGVVAFVSVVLVATVVIFMVADNNRPLPKWVPRGKVIKNTVLSVVPPGMRGKKKEKPVVHKDMYDAMKSGKY